MAIRAEVEGNLTRNPTSRVVSVSGESRRIVEIRVFADAHRRDGDRWRQDEERSCAVDVTIWSEALGEAVMSHYRKGMRVLVTGDLHLHEYSDGSGGHHAGLRMVAEKTAIVPFRLDEVTPSPRRVDAWEGGSSGGTDGTSAGDTNAAAAFGEPD